ncbi:hypothetical protein KI387_026448, partial [Taxus chinensis]
MEEELSLFQAPVFNGTNYVFWKFGMNVYLSSFGYYVWKSINIENTSLSYPMEVIAKNAILIGLVESIHSKVFECESAKDLWDKLEFMYEEHNMSNA